MKQKWMLAVLAVVVVALAGIGFRLGDRTVSVLPQAPKPSLPHVKKDPVEQTTYVDFQTHSQQVADEMKKVQADLQRASDVPSNYITLRFTDLEAFVFPEGPYQMLAVNTRKQIAASMEAEGLKHLIKGYFIPFYFVKPDATAYIMVIKQTDSGENNIYRYQLKNNAYVQVDEQQVSGVPIGDDLK